MQGGHRQGAALRSPQEAKAGQDLHTLATRGELDVLAEMFRASDGKPVYLDGHRVHMMIEVTGIVDSTPVALDFASSNSAAPQG